MTRPVRMLRRALGLAALLVLALPVGNAMAGRLIVTGHDQDLHCVGGQGCHFLTVAVNYVRGAAPDTSKPVLILDRDPNGGTSYQMEQALDLAFPPGSVPRKVVDPRSAEFTSERLRTDTYSAIIVASDATCGGCDLNSNESFDPNVTPDSDAINARADDIAAFFNEGGGILALSGAEHGDGNPDTGKESYYQFVPIPLGGSQVSPPFTLTPEGQALGFTDDENAEGGSDINCCATHNSFAEPPANSPLKVAERDSSVNPETGNPAPAPETLFAEGTIFGGEIIDPDEPAPPVQGRSANVEPVRGTVLVKLPPGTSAAKAKSLGLRGAQSGFVKLQDAKSVPMGSTLETTKGVVKLTTAANSAGNKLQDGDFSKGQFKLSQTRKNPLTQLSMRGGGLKSCKTRVPKGGSAAAKRSRRLFGNARGRFRTRGRNSSATVRGTQWTMTDTCAGTTTSVKTGSVVVRDFTLRKNRVVKKGQRYFAKAPKRKLRK
jgi:hypothetical protein